MLDISNPLAAFRIDGAVAFVTGAGSGIGREAAKVLAAAGAVVICADIKGQTAQAVAEEIRAADAQARGVTLDVCDEEGVEACIAEAAAGGRLDILINSAGISRRKPALDISRADWEAVNAVNVTGSFSCARAAARQMRTGGSIVNISSVLGFSGGIYPNAAYQASKGAVVNLTRALAVEWAGRSIRVNGVAPGWIDTPFISNASANPEAKASIERATPLGRIGRVEEVAGAILYLASPASSFVTGHTIVVDGGFLAC